MRIKVASWSVLKKLLWPLKTLGILSTSGHAADSRGGSSGAASLSAAAFAYAQTRWGLL